MSNPYEPPTSNPFAAPHGTPPVQQGDDTGGVIPYKNPHALAAYYIGILTILCCVTPLPLGLLPLYLGVVGLKKRRENPIIKGSVHAWIGIVLGGLSALCSVLMLAVIGIALVAERQRQP
jgi:hypothetical protein